MLEQYQEEVAKLTRKELESEKGRFWGRFESRSRTNPCPWIDSGDFDSKDWKATQRTKEDKNFLAFQRRIRLNPEQVLR